MCPCLTDDDWEPKFQTYNVSADCSGSNHGCGFSVLMSTVSTAATFSPLSPTVGSASLTIHGAADSVMATDMVPPPGRSVLSCNRALELCNLGTNPSYPLIANPDGERRRGR